MVNKNHMTKEILYEEKIIAGSFGKFQNYKRKYFKSKSEANDALAKDLISFFQRCSGRAPRHHEKIGADNFRGYLIGSKEVWGYITEVRFIL